MDQTKPAICVFIDLAKAFDTVSHQDLLETLENLGFRDTSYNLLKSYLTDREQYVQIGNEVSDQRTVRCGVPQGTVLGPLLFTIYINDMFEILIQGKIVSFADDTAIFYESSDWNTLKRTVESDFINIVEFLNSKKLSINWTKTCFLPFTSYPRNMPAYSILKISINNLDHNIYSVKNVKYLGITLDSHLRWDEHINCVVKKIRCLINKFKFYTQIFATEQLKILYFSLVQSHLLYGIVAWGGVTKIYLRRLEIAQKWILKIIFQKEYLSPSDELYRDSGMLDLRQLFFSQLAFKQYKRKNSNSYVKHKYSTRQRENTFLIPNIKKTIGERCHSYLAPKIYNAIPNEIALINSFSLFKKQLTAWIMQIPRAQIHKLVDLKNVYL